MEFLTSRVVIRPRDPELSLAFYRDVLGLGVFREFPGGTVFFLGGGFLEVSGRGDGSPSQDLALWLQVRDIHATVDELRGRVEMVSEPELQPWGLWEAWFADPDGVRIVVVQVPPDHPMRKDSRPG
ncbi:MAG: VOC family protein [Actinomycetota bacterium]|nr:VOC family protein [Actinomycetota bacterium]MDQ3577053.1 VOC family protein [Actinomycetota bacterium]